MVTTDAARLLRLPDHGLHPGARADLVVLDAETARDALREQSPRRWVLRGGRVVAETVREQRLHHGSTSPQGIAFRPKEQSSSSAQGGSCDEARDTSEKCPA
jgi:adenine deaminase